VSERERHETVECKRDLLNGRSDLLQARMQKETFYMAKETCYETHILSE
jgi:hypothetical protein